MLCLAASTSGAVGTGEPGGFVLLQGWLKAMGRDGGNHAGSRAGRLHWGVDNCEEERVVVHGVGAWESLFLFWFWTDYGIGLDCVGE